ncbi:zinc finger protein ZAT9-like [Neltuma alba]|uniref:zinc finger protein ZAT9-like n=1 Tax=Neltuma alba TaxID=207710 RepID=UPI0010A3FE06|nr:zinc finger protein ZAT9-like [Prosopis alba]XP_028787642.1 zinc finger protein ZAT9-like [Prosopis alba]
MEEEGRGVMKHVCKFCSKSFPCGRSLGGHMRSHITNVSAEAEEKLATTKKIQSVINDGAGSSKVGEYDLRENPKKTWRFADSRSGEAPLVTEDKFCKECGKAFPSWKALFGHMKCHSEKASINNNNNLENQASASQKVVTDSQSDNEGTGNPHRRRRSKRRTRFVTTASTSSLSFANPSSSVSEAEQEQEEVAMSLMMLSRDVGHWGGLNSVVESSDNNSAYFEARSYVVRTNLSSKIEAGKVKLTIGSNSESANLNSKGKKPESLATGSALNGFKAIKATVSINGLVKNCKEKKHELDNQSTLEDSEDELWKSEVNGTELDSAVKRRFSDSEMKSNCKKGKFKCTTCNKIFPSYQALGGHRSSHKKLKGCSASRNESSENSIETDLNNGYVIEKQELIGSVNFENEEEIITEPKKNKVHECPICLKVFPSGQALGGHKRSHFAAEGSLVLEKPVQEIRDFLDLNLPASAEEESNSQVENYPPWWVVQGHHHHHHPKQEALVGLLSN